ncbi:hypothetical protein GA0061096_2684 [Fictibacillus enclensis]|nr:hypothetical protein GA0061096_2684 [Fictibacillus enclensis]
MLMVKCPKCKKSFTSPIQLDEVSFRSSRIENNEAKCPNCKQEILIGQEDMYFDKGFNQ